MSQCKRQALENCSWEAMAKVLLLLLGRIREEEVKISQLLWSRTGNTCVRAAQCPEMVELHKT